VVWKILGATCDSPSVYAEYTAITNASGTVTPADSVTTYGPFMIDVNCRGYTGIAFQAYSCDAVPVEMHVTALGYGGDARKAG
jgi:hypothetical protein